MAANARNSPTAHKAGKEAQKCVGDFFSSTTSKYPYLLTGATSFVSTLVTGTWLYNFGFKHLGSAFILYIVQDVVRYIYALEVKAAEKRNEELEESADSEEEEDVVTKSKNLTRLQTSVVKWLTFIWLNGMAYGATIGIVMALGGGRNSVISASVDEKSNFTSCNSNFKTYLLFFKQKI